LNGIDERHLFGSENDTKRKKKKKKDKEATRVKQVSSCAHRHPPLTGNVF